MIDTLPADKSTESNDRPTLFQVNGNKESQLTPLALLIFVAILFPLSAFKMPGLVIISWPVLGIFLWIAISLIRQSRQPWIVARKSRLELKLKVDNKTDSVLVPWENINSFELSQPYKDQLIINLLHPINVGSGINKLSRLTTSNEIYDIDPDDLLNKLSTYLNPAYANEHPYKYVPNVVPIKDRIAKSFFAFILILWAIYGAIANDLSLPTKRQAMHLHGVAMWLMCVAFVMTAANLISWVVDHYDQRDNERQYRTFRAYSKVIGYLLFGMALVSAIVQ
jgi:hypothetical protein